MIQYPSFLQVMFCDLDDLLRGGLPNAVTELYVALMTKYGQQKFSMDENCLFVGQCPLLSLCRLCTLIIDALRRFRP
jgi:hypothetical protein